MNKKLPDPKVGRKSQNMAVKESDKMVILVPHNVKADEVIMLSDNQPSYDFSELAKLISNADVDRINKELIEIYYNSLSAQGQERQPDHKMTNRELQRFCNSTMALSTRGYISLLPSNERHWRSLVRIYHQI